MIANALAAYLTAWLWVLGVTLGAWPILLIHQLTGGAWGKAIGRPLRAALSTLPLVAVGFVPIALGVHPLYAWTHDDWIGPTWWLSTPFFVARAVAYFAIWIAVSRWSVRRDDDAPATMEAGAVGLIVYLVTASLAGFDWAMSLTPEWHSTAFGLLFATGQVLNAFALAVWLALRRRDVPYPDVRNDLGNLLLAFTMLWAYIAFTQYLIVWLGNLPADIGWYVVRGETSWRGVALAIFVAGFAIPFAALLFRAVKRVPARLGAVAALAVVARAIDLWWTVVPTFRTDGFAIDLVDPLMFVCVVGGWSLWFRRIVRARRAPLPHAA